MEKTINSEQQVTMYVLFGALSFSSLIFGYLIFAGFLGFNKSGPWPVDDLSSSQNFGLYIAIVVGLANFILFRKNMNEDVLKEKFKSINALTPPPVFNIPKQAEDFKNASESEKKEFIFRSYLMQKYILHWSLNNTIATLGIVSVVIGSPTSSGYYFIASALVMNFIMRPKINEILLDFQAKS